LYIGAKRQPEYYNQIIAQKPKVEKLIQEEFPQLKQAYVKSDVLPDIAGRHHVFAAPVIHVF
jgi:thioredoxin 1